MDYGDIVMPAEMTEPKLTVPTALDLNALAHHLSEKREGLILGLVDDRLSVTQGEVTVLIGPFVGDKIQIEGMTIMRDAVVEREIKRDDHDLMAPGHEIVDIVFQVLDQEK